VTSGLVKRSVNQNSPHVDASLIEEMLRLSPVERLRQNDRAAALAVALKEAFLTHEKRWSNRAR